MKRPRDFTLPELIMISLAGWIVGIVTANLYMMGQL